MKITRNKVCCPLCSHENQTILETIDTRTLKEIWHKSASIDITRISDKTSSIDFYKCPKCDLGFFNPQIPGDSKFYGDLAKDSMYYLHEGKSEFYYSAKKILSGSSVLDIGSGRGVFSQFLDPSTDYTGLELSTAAVKLAKESNINVINSTIEEFVKTTNKQFDYIVSFQVLEHIENISSFIVAIKKALKDGGKIIFAVPNNESFISKTPNHILNLPPHHQLHWTRKSLNFLASNFNLEVEDIYCERVSKAHLKSFIYSNIYDFFRKASLMTYRHIKNSIPREFLSKLSWKIASITTLLFGSSLFKNRIGQTIIICMKK